MARVANNSELKGAHFEIFQGFSSNFAKNVRFLYYREANKKRHVPLKVAPMCSKEHGFDHPVEKTDRLERGAPKAVFFKPARRASTVAKTLARS